MEKDFNKRLKWFQDRVGKIIYRGKTSCECEICDCVKNEGLIIMHDMHAIYLNDCSFELEIEYRDKK